VDISKHIWSSLQITLPSTLCITSYLVQFDTCNLVVPSCNIIHDICAKPSTNGLENYVLKYPHRIVIRLRSISVTTHVHPLGQNIFMTVWKLNATLYHVFF